MPEKKFKAEDKDGYASVILSSECVFVAEAAVRTQHCFSKTKEDVLIH